MHQEKNARPLVKAEAEFKGSKISLETGKLAVQAGSSVLAKLGDTTVLVTVVSTPTSEETDGFPLRVEYEERFYAGGLIGGSRFTRREGKPGDEAIVSGRLIDHAIRPLFPKDFGNDTQIIVTVLSIDQKHSPVLLGFIAASAAFSISGLPFNSPVVPLRIHKINGSIEATLDEEQEDSEMDLLVSYLEDGTKVQAIEARGNIVNEEEVLNAVKMGAEESKPLFAFLKDFTKKAGAAAEEYPKAWLTKELVSEFTNEVLPVLQRVYSEMKVFDRSKWDETIERMTFDLAEKYKDDYSEFQLKLIIGEVEKDMIRDMVVNKKTRFDGRKFDEIRPLSAEVSVLPRVHGSGLFNRGLTQALTVVTLASGSQKLLVQDMDGEKDKRYMHHYNFPPFSTGEVGRIGGANRRAVGHGMLAEKAIVPVLPTEEEFPYAIRVVSEILSSNGSTSMASVCGSSLALMDAGVPIKSHVAGIGIGLFVNAKKENPEIEDFIVLTDISGTEDFAGYMDFKMAGTKDGMTAVQMELKVQGIPVGLLDVIFTASKSARMKVLDALSSAISSPRPEISQYAPKIDFIKIDKKYIGQVIGSGGATIKGIMEETGTEIDIDEKEDHAMVSISGRSDEDIRNAKDRILALVTPVEIGDVFEGTVSRVEGYGAFVEIGPKKEGLVHISEYSYNFMDNLDGVVKVGDKMKVKVIGIENGKISLSKKALDKKPEGYVERERSLDSSSRNFRDGRNFRNQRRPGGFDTRRARSRY